LWLGEAIGGGSADELLVAEDEVRDEAPHGDDGVVMGCEGAENAFAETEIWCCAFWSCDCALCN
jgi:hypothetical protein